MGTDGVVTEFINEAERQFMTRPHTDALLLQQERAIAEETGRVRRVSDRAATWVMWATVPAAWLALAVSTYLAVRQ